MGLTHNAKLSGGVAVRLGEKLDIKEVSVKIDYFRKCRNMPFVRVGMRVYHSHNDKFGRVSGANDNANINVTFDGKNYSVNCHPKWKMKYYDKKGDVIAEYGD